MNEAAQKVNYMALKAEDNMLWSPLDMLRHIVQELKNDEVPAKKAIVILLDDSDFCYDVNWRLAGMKVSEAMALLKYVDDYLSDLLRGKV